MTSTGLCAFIRKTDLLRSPSTQQASVWRLHLASPYFPRASDAAAYMGRASLRRAPLDGDAPRRSLRGIGTTRPARRRYPRLLPAIARRSLNTLSDPTSALRQVSVGAMFAIPGC